MGKGQMSSTIQFASWISAQRRWAMTGTPTKQTSSELNQIKGLLTFLQHDFFGRQLDGAKWWRNGIAKPWREGTLAAYFRLKSLLCLLMKRHTKLDIAELPPPHFEQSLIPMSFVEATTYNTLVCGVQSNILLTSMEGKTSGEVDSLLHKSQSKHARGALANVRRVCVGWSRVVPTLELKLFLETIHLMSAHGFSKEKVEEVRQYLFRAQEEHLTPCGCCGLQLSTPLLLSCCGGFICPECMDGKSTTCILCDNTFDVDEFQRLQPGFVFTWKSNMERSSARRNIDQNTVSSPSVPNGRIVEDESQPSMMHIAPPVESSRRRTRRPGDGHECEYDFTAGNGICKLCREPHDSCQLFNDQSRCPVCHRLSEECPEDESKAAYLVQKLCGLLLESRERGWHAPRHRPLKVIVYSQFRPALNVVGDRLLKRFGTKCIAEYWGKFRVQELHKFTTVTDCFCMLLSNDGSEGLDLSFVTHIFFLEEIWDASLRDQAVARAWRMGAKGRVEVETLLAQNSVEETMQDIESTLRSGQHHRDTTGGRALGLIDGVNSLTEYQQAKTKILLQSLRFNTDYHCLASKPASSSRLDGTPSPSHESTSMASVLVPVSKTVTIGTDESSGERPTKRVRFDDSTTL